MNVVSALVGLSIAGTAMPMVAQMSVMPAITQRKTTNFGIAEQKAVTYAALNEGQDELAETPKGCELEQVGDGAVSITCTEGENAYKATVTRTFRSSIDLGGYAGNQRVFANATPGAYEPHQCPADDPWGVQYTNAQWAKNWNWGACLPSVLWNKNRYLESNPDDWLYDISGYGFGAHPDY